MSIACVCDACGKKLRVKDEMAGRKGRCPACGERFLVPEASGDLLDLAEGEAVADESAEPIAVEPVTRTKRRTGRSREWTDADRAWFGGAVNIIVIGVLSLILPIFGLQFRRLGRLGELAPVGGTVLILIGLFVMLRVYLGKIWGGTKSAAATRRWVGRFVKVAAGGLVLLIAGLVAINYVANVRHQAGRVADPPTDGPRLPASMPLVAVQIRPEPLGQSGLPSMEEAPRDVPPFRDPSAPRETGPSGRPGPRYGRGAMPPGGPAAGEARIVSQFAADKVVRLKLEGMERRDSQNALGAKLRELCDPGSRSVSTRSNPGGVQATIAPVTDLDACAARIDFGKVTHIDRATRTITVAVDENAFR